ncbi:unnamed protein product [Symbiodinium microadriaticum]|nr:unnamed protein product [Symbiodinium microadriaticum]
MEAAPTPTRNRASWPCRPFGSHPLALLVAGWGATPHRERQDGTHLEGQE